MIKRCLCILLAAQLAVLPCYGISGLDDLALAKPAWASSVRGDNPSYAGSRAVDGELSTVWMDKSNAAASALRIQLGDGAAAFNRIILHLDMGAWKTLELRGGDTALSAGFEAAPLIRRIDLCAHRSYTDFAPWTPGKIELAFQTQAAKFLYVVVPEKIQPLPDLSIRVAQVQVYRSQSADIAGFSIGQSEPLYANGEAVTLDAKAVDGLGYQVAGHLYDVTWQIVEGADGVALSPAGIIACTKPERGGGTVKIRAALAADPLVYTELDIPIRHNLIPGVAAFFDGALPVSSLQAGALTAWVDIENASREPMEARLYLFLQGGAEPEIFAARHTLQTGKNRVKLNFKVPPAHRGLSARLYLWDNGMRPLRTAFEFPRDRQMKDILGSTHVSGKYTLSEELGLEPVDFLNEGADRLEELGMEIIKLWLTGSYKSAYPYHADWEQFGPVSNLTDLVRTPYYREVISRSQFKTIVFVATEFAAVNHQDGLSQEEYRAVYREFYDLTAYLLTAYEGTGKTFVLQNWESDEALNLNKVSDLAVQDLMIQGMTDWTNARQDAITAARDDYKRSAVTVAGAFEVTRIPVYNTYNHRTAIDVIVPDTYCDLYSFSNWLTRTPSDTYKLWDMLEYIKEKAPDSALFGANNIYLGEFGAYETYFYTQGAPDQASGVTQMQCVKDQLEIAVHWGIKYAIYWQVYCNGLKTGVSVTPPQQAEATDLKGVWLIRPDGSYTPTYHYFQSILEGSILSDDLHSWNRVYATAGNLALLRTDRPYAQGAATRVHRTDNQAGAITYALDKPAESIHIKLFLYTNQNVAQSLDGQLKIFGSDAGASWTEIPYVMDTAPVATALGWYSIGVRTAVNIPSSYGSIKVTLSGTESYTPQIDRISIVKGSGRK